MHRNQLAPSYFLAQNLALLVAILKSRLFEGQYFRLCNLIDTGNILIRVIAEISYY
jgi:hypothetical protein